MSAIQYVSGQSNPLRPPAYIGPSHHAQRLAICEFKPALRHEFTLPVRGFARYELGHPLAVLLRVFRTPSLILLLPDWDDPVEIHDALLERHTRVPGHAIQIPVVPIPRTPWVHLFRGLPRQIDARAEAHFLLHRCGDDS